ncbi:sigma 54-interacting transcriptional regulator [Acinetobacter sichuanensis]|uniref:PAS domain-containing protein n=1 Tax=Acinetobacter sichuanensis TaxID=2136183 RepID=A0A371YP82_9GAMM|nr:sigma 54-interacting transcriptional regulator [Acinetobacter sichuanensis]RFC83287.1 PAS domain-containing protein [Acinetobacter sichuanensis]
MLNQKPINILVSYIKTPSINGFRALAEQTIAKIHTDQIGFVECHISDVLDVAQQLVENGSEILLCTGATAHYLQKKLPIEIHPIRTGAFDVIQAISNLKQYQKIALLGSTSSVNLTQYADVFALKIQQFSYDSYLAAKKAVELAQQQEFDAVIGSPVAVEMALSLNMAAQLAISSNALHDHLESALQRLDKIREEKQHTQRLTEIFNHLTDGICFISNTGNIRFINQSMTELLGIHATAVLNQSVHHIFQHLDLNLDNSHQILTVGAKKLAVHLSVLKNEHIDGFILSAQDLESFEKSSSEFRKVSSRKFNTRYRFSDLISKDPQFLQSIELAKQYAQTEATILITGESGTGKELLAQSIHQYSARAKAPFVAINCASFPESILESELFGYEEGAFTGAKKNGKVGLIEAAHNGTLFLDEIGDMPLHLQTRFLRVLQERQINRLGSIVSHHVNIRVLAATHCDLEEQVKKGEFRADLYYRLNILRVFVPALRQRRVDILELVSHFLSKHDLSREQLPEHVLKALQKYHWLGNVRELENIIERLAVMSRLDQSLLSQHSIERHIPEIFQKADQQEQSPLKAVKINQELQLIEQAIDAADGNLDIVAQNLNISRTTLWRKMKLLKN